MPENILKLQNKFDVFLFDMFGVVWDGKKFIDGAMDVMEALKKSGKKVIVLSNNTGLSKNVEENYEKKGLIKGKHYDKIVTSGDLAKDVFSSDDRAMKYYNLYKPRAELFEGSKYQETKSLENADFIYVGVPQVDGKNSLDMADFEQDLQKLYAMGKVLICANPDLTAFETSHDEPVIRQGSIAQRYIELGGEVEFFGKPYPDIYDFALQNYDGDDDRILMIGDTLETDILGANSYGIKSALTMTGIAVDNMKKEGFDNIEEYCEEVGIMPDYIVSF